MPEALFMVFSLDSKGANVFKSCRSRQELSNEHSLAKFGFDTAENEPCKVCPIPTPLTREQLLRVPDEKFAAGWSGSGTFETRVLTVRRISAHSSSHFDNDRANFLMHRLKGIFPSNFARLNFLTVPRTAPGPSKARKLLSFRTTEFQNLECINK